MEDSDQVDDALIASNMLLYESVFFFLFVCLRTR